MVEAIAAEDDETRDNRRTLKARKEDLEEARDICARLAMRKDRGMVSPQHTELRSVLAANLESFSATISN